MKKTSKILLFVMALLLLSNSLVQPSVAADNADAFTREDAVALFEKAIECYDILQFAYPYYSDNEETEYFDYSFYKNPKIINGEFYCMVNKNHKYGSLDKTIAWAESLFTQDIANKYVKIVYLPTSDGEKENYLFDSEGNLWKNIYGWQVGHNTRYNILGFQGDNSRAVLTVESPVKRPFPENDTVTNTVNFVKTDAGWRVAESGYFNYYLGIAPPDRSPETGDGTVARAAVFAVGAALAAAVPALILTAKRRREEK